MVYAYAPLALASALLCAAAHAPLTAQTVTFEAYALAAESSVNGGTLREDGAFDLGAVSLPHAFTESQFGVSWSGWAISNRTDTTDGSFNNDQSAVTGVGNDGSDNYAVAFGSTRIDVPAITTAGGGRQAVLEAYVTNTTYAARVIRDGNQFSKKFGGVTGADPDFFAVTFNGYAEGRLTDSVRVFLADYRADDPAEDFILDEWRAVDLSVLGPVDSILLSFAGTDVGDFGLNTPAYVAVDDLTVEGATGLFAAAAAPAPRVFPSVAKEALRVETDAPVGYAVYDMLGRQTLAGVTAREIDVADLRPGAYAVRFRDSATDAWTAAARFVRAD